MLRKSISSAEFCSDVACGVCLIRHEKKKKKTHKHVCIFMLCSLVIFFFLLFAFCIMHFNWAFKIFLLVYVITAYIGDSIATGERISNDTRRKIRSDSNLYCIVPHRRGVYFLLLFFHYFLFFF